LPPPRPQRFHQPVTDAVASLNPHTTANTAMPYFVYRISPERKLTLIETFAKFKEAKDFARSLRAQQATDDRNMVRMIFAEDPQKARLLLSDQRTAKADGDD
jgi:hypothetical protein